MPSQNPSVQRPDHGTDRYQGPAATPFDKTAAAGFADYLEKAKSGAATLSSADEYFWRLLNGSEADVALEHTDDGEEAGQGGMTTGGAGFVGDGDGWARASGAQIEEQLARLAG